MQHTVSITPSSSPIAGANPQALIRNFIIYVDNLVTAQALPACHVSNTFGRVLEGVYHCVKLSELCDIETAINVHMEAWGGALPNSLGTYMVVGGGGAATEISVIKLGPFHVLLGPDWQPQVSALSTTKNSCGWHFMFIVSSLSHTQ